MRSARINDCSDWQMERMKSYNKKGGHNLEQADASTWRR